jgi:hypothetical protein
MVHERRQATSEMAGRDRVTRLGQQARDAWAALMASKLHDERTPVEGVDLERDEVAYCVVEDARLVEPRRGGPQTETDSGLFVVTNTRCVFVGPERSTEWAYSKLLEYSLEGESVAMFRVSDREKTTGVRYTVESTPQIDATIAAAIARFHGEDEHAALVDELEQDHHRIFAEWEEASSHVPPTA